jgi:recombination protein RecA
MSDKSKKSMDTYVNKNNNVLTPIDINQVPFLIPTGYIAVDQGIIGAEGIPTGILVELFGDEGCGKTTMAMQIAKQTQKLGGYVLLADTESWEVSRMQQVGVELDEDKIARIEGTYMEEIFKNIQALADFYKKQSLDIPLTFIFDSIALTPTKLELDAIAKGNTPPVAATARILTSVLKNLQLMLIRTPILMVMINQFRMDLSNIGMPSFMQTRPKKKTTGGTALKYTCSLRLELTAKDTVQQDGIDVGYIVKAKAEKNQVNAPGIEREYVQYYNGGIGNWYTIQVEGEKLGLIKQNGSWYSFTGTDGKEVKYQGRHGILSVSDEDYEYMKEQVKQGMLHQLDTIKNVKAR